MFVPNVREPKGTDKRTGTEFDNLYYEGNLKDEKHIAYKDGYDRAVSDVLNLFNNLGVYAEQFAAAGINVLHIESDNEYVNGLNPYSDGREVRVEEVTEIKPKEFKVLSPEEKILGTMRDLICHWAEMERNDIITSMLDEEYSKEG